MEDCGVCMVGKNTVQKHEMQISPHVMTALADLTFKYAGTLLPLSAFYELTVRVWWNKVREKNGNKEHVSSYRGVGVVCQRERVCSKLKTWMWCVKENKYSWELGKSWWWIDWSFTGICIWLPKFFHVALNLAFLCIGFLEDWGCDAEELAKDVELFAHHAGRKSVMVDDVLLAGMFHKIWSFVWVETTQKVDAWICLIFWWELMYLSTQSLPQSLSSHPCLLDSLQLLCGQADTLWNRWGWSFQHTGMKMWWQNCGHLHGVSQKVKSINQRKSAREPLTKNLMHVPERGDAILLLLQLLIRTHGPLVWTWTRLANPKLLYLGAGCWDGHKFVE